MSVSGGRLMNMPRLAAYIIHQQILAERVGRGEVSFPAAKLRNLLDEVDQVVIASQHEGVDQDSCALALGHFFDCLRDDERIEAEGILVDTAVFERQR